MHLATFVGCGDGNNDSNTGTPRDRDDLGPAIAIMTRIQGPDTENFYVHIIEELPNGGVLDNSQALELPPSAISTDGGFLYVSNRENLTVTKYEVTANLQLRELERLSIQGLGAQFAPPAVWGGPGNPYLVDWNSYQIIRFDPEAMTLVDATPMPAEYINRSSLRAFVNYYDPAVRDDRMWFTWSWVDYGVPEALQEVSLASIPLEGPPEFSPLSTDTRCGFNGAFPFTGPEGHVYTVGLSLWDPVRTPNSPSCVLRLLPESTEFDPDYNLDLLEATDANAVGAAWPMDEGRKLLVMYIPTEGLQPANASEFYSIQAYRTGIVDLETGALTEVDLPMSSVGSWLSLSLDGDRLLQFYPDEFSNAELTRVNLDGSTETIVAVGENADFQFVLRVR